MSHLTRRVGRLEASAGGDKTVAVATLARIFPGVHFAELDGAGIDAVQELLERSLAKTDLQEAADFRARRLGYVPHAPRNEDGCFCGFCKMRRGLRAEAGAP